MTRKHFIAIANAVNDSRPSEGASDGLIMNIQADWIAKNMADEFAKFNDNFDRDRFLVACGVTA